MKKLLVLAIIFILLTPITSVFAECREPVWTVTFGDDVGEWKAYAECLKKQYKRNSQEEFYRQEFMKWRQMYLDLLKDLEKCEEELPMCKYELYMYEKGIKVKE